MDRYFSFRWFCVDGGSVTKSCLTLATPRTVACQAPLTMGFSRQEYWSGLPFPSCYPFIYNYFRSSFESRNNTKCQQHVSEQNGPNLCILTKLPVLPKSDSRLIKKMHIKNRKFQIFFACHSALSSPFVLLIFMDTDSYFTSEEFL